ncbi:hypothetical protein UA45_22575 [Morganella morganii]|uniref:Uncharacterized protein n=1 Tax=Morganella morganii TaxID=582 RepID=A0A0D8L129_MORMO|nr:hypothetical protein UA45_22575 [Morganella morganii]
MHDSTLYYFEQQRQLLLDGLEAFRRQHPHQAQLLGISGQRISDPQLRHCSTACLSDRADCSATGSDRTAADGNAGPHGIS